MTPTKKIHIFGASGSGTTTLAKSISETVGGIHYDTDDYFWMPTIPRCTVKRNSQERHELLKTDLEKSDSWILSGSLCGWGDFAIPMFDLAIFLWIPTDIRMERLKKREVSRHGDLNSPQHPLHKEYYDFLVWAEAYDTGGVDMRSKVLHEKWMESLTCKILRIEGDISVAERLEIVLKTIQQSNS